MKINRKNTNRGWVSEWTEDGKTQWFNDHYMKVYSYYKDKGFNRHEGLGENGKIENHPLEGKKIIFPEKHKKGRNRQRDCFVDSVCKHWDKGYYEIILYYSLSETESELLCTDIIDDKMYGRSHGTMFYKNINSHCPDIKEYIKENEDIKFE